MYPIPANATRIRYLESTGTQYIDTGIVPTGATGIRCDFSLTTNANFSPVFWSRGTSATDRAYCFESEYNGRSNGQARWDYGSYGALQTSNILVIGQRYTVEANGGTLTVAGSTLQRAEQTFTGAGSIILFNFCNYVDGQRQMISATAHPIRIYSCAIYDGSTLVRDFVPVRVGQVGYLFDRVSGQLFGNAGTGDFVLGPDTFAQGVVPTRMMAMGVRKRPYDADVEYLEINGDGTYIDTGVVPENNPSADIVAQYIGTSKSSAQTTPLFGVRNFNVSPQVLFAVWVRSDTLKLAINYAATDTGWTNQVIDTTSFHTFSLDRLGGYYDGVKYANLNHTIGTNVGGSVYIGAANQPNNREPSATRGVKMRFREFNLYNNGVLVFAGRAVRIGSTGYVYDTVSDSIIGATAGTVIVGPDK